jgi:hypothetical protein
MTNLYSDVVFDRLASFVKSNVDKLINSYTVRYLYKKINAMCVH